jgi:hypothetical protein
MSRANGRSAFMIAVGVLATIAAAAPAAADELNTPVFVTPSANGAQPNTSAQPEGQNQVADPNQLNEIDRASPANAAAQPSAPAPSSDTAASSAPASNAAAAASASGEHSIWNETSLIGKIFIGFGALLTIASAARMFMA